MFTPFDPIIILLKVYLTEYPKEEEKAVCMKILLAALFIIIKELKAGEMSGLGKFQPIFSVLVHSHSKVIMKIMQPHDKSL